MDVPCLKGGSQVPIKHNLNHIWAFTKYNWNKREYLCFIHLYIDMFYAISLILWMPLVVWSDKMIWRNVLSKRKATKKGKGEEEMWGVCEPGSMSVEKDFGARRGAASHITPGMIIVCVIQNDCDNPIQDFLNFSASALELWNMVSLELWTLLQTMMLNYL